MSPPERDALLRDLEDARLQPADWDAVARLVDELAVGSATDDDLRSLLFEARVRGRFSGTRSTAGVQPTKQTSVLPVVGLVCGGLLVGVGALLGGGLILAGIVVLGILVAGIAIAGSRVAHRGGDEDRDAGPHPVSIPPAVAAAVAQLRRSE